MNHTRVDWHGAKGKYSSTNIGCQEKHSFISLLANNEGHAIAQEVNRRLPSAAARVRAQVRLYGICDG
jgi:hypothetical protein